MATVQVISTWRGIVFIMCTCCCLLNCVGGLHNETLWGYFSSWMHRRYRWAPAPINCNRSAVHRLLLWLHPPATSSRSKDPQNHFLRVKGPQLLPWALEKELGDWRPTVTPAGFATSWHLHRQGGVLSNNKTIHRESTFTSPVGIAAENIRQRVPRTQAASCWVFERAARKLSYVSTDLSKDRPPHTHTHHHTSDDDSR